MCPVCQNSHSEIVKKGFFAKKSTRSERIQRFFCKACARSFSTQTKRLSYYDKKPHINQPLFRLLSSGVSQRRCALIFQVDKKTVARKLVRLGKAAQFHIETTSRLPQPSHKTAVFDDMETFEHTKCKPLSITVAVQEHSRFIIAARVSQMPSKGRLAAVSLKKYGYRPDLRREGLTEVLARIKRVMPEIQTIKSDLCPRYPRAVRQILPGVIHDRSKGRKPCIAGLGELKEGGFDPLFSLNHSCAMFRDNLKRLSRKSWCTTKKPENLQHLLNLYACFHNQRLLGRKRVPQLADPI